jgi:UDP-N-acetylmuramoyl-tripeptide--D-alanyl-D-alanine ligase
MKLKLSEIYKLFGKGMDKKDASVPAISIDTRSLKRGEVFVAIKGDRTDGHRYVKDAVKKGALIVIAERGPADIRVKSTVSALLSLAEYYADKFKKMKITAITGSNGKTTTKEMLAAMLAEAFGGAKVLKSQKSFNNYIGVPLTVFKMAGRHKTAVLEMGMNNPGEISRLAGVVKIDVAIITNIGRSHIGRLKSQDNIMKAKAGIFEGIKPGGRAVLNADDAYFGQLKKKAKARRIKIISFGINNRADVKAEVIKTGGSGTVFRLAAQGKVENMKIKLKGIHNVYNAAAASAAALNMGASFADIKNALLSLGMEGSLRFEERTVRGIRVIEDCYNANPDSFKAGIDTLRSLGLHSVIVASGDMLELGPKSALYHAEIGALIARLHIKNLLAFGRYAGHVVRGFIKAGGDRNAAAAYRSKEKMAADLKAAAKPGDTVYVKGSRGNKLEDIIKQL